MKNFLLLSYVVIIFSCTKQNTFSNPDPEKFVAQIKAATYNLKSPQGFLELPNFKREDIPELMKSVKDLQPITNFPANPISSKAYPETYLGEFLMWTIEGIRTGTKYPSLGGRLYDTKNMRLLTRDEIQQVADLYIAWWEQAKKPIPLYQSFNPYQSSPIEFTNYRWD